MTSTVEDRFLADVTRWLKEADVAFGQCCVVPQGVLFLSETSARRFAERHDKDLVKVDGEISGWLAKNRSAST